MVALVLGLVFSMAQVTVADDRVTFNGHTRIRGYYIDADDSGDDDNVSRYIDFRFRLGAVVNVAEGITANLRLDFNDNSVWGSDTGTEGRTEGDDELTVERAYIRIEKDMFIFQGGEIWQGFGHFSAYTPQGVGFATRLKLPLMIDLNYFKVDEGDDVTDDNDSYDDSDKDHDVYALQGTYKSDMFTIGGYYATEINDAATDDTTDDDFENKNVIGLFGDTKIGPVGIKAALDMFSGTKNDDVDYMGTQMWLNGEMGLTEAFTFGADIFYAMAADDDGSEEQITRIAKSLDDVPFDVFCHVNHLGRYSDTTSPFGGFPTPYEPQDNAGVTAFNAYGLYNVMENLTLGLSAGYWMPQESDYLGDGVDDWESSILIQASVLWTFAPNCDLFAGMYHRADDMDNDATDDDPDAELAMYYVLRITF